MPDDVTTENSRYPANHPLAQASDGSAARNAPSGRAADAAAATEENGNIFSRMWNSGSDAINNTIYDVSAGAYNLFADDENEITRDDVRALDQRITAQRDEIVSETVSYVSETNALVLKGEIGEVAARNGHLALSLADGAVDGIVGLGALGVTAVDATINNAPRLWGSGPAFGEDHSSWNTFDAIDGVDDAVLGGIYDLAGYELPTDGVYGYANFAGSFVGAGGGIGKGASLGAKWTNKIFKSTDEAADGARNAPKPGNPAPKPDAGNGTEAAARKGAEETVEETAEAATAGRSFAGRAADVVTGRSPKGIYKNSNYSVADKMTELSRAEELGMDKAKAAKFTNRLVNDVGAGRATIKPSEIRNLERSGDFSEDLMKNLRSAQASSQTMMGRTAFKASHLGDTFRNSVGVGNVVGTASTVAFAPVKLTFNSLTSMKGAFIGAAAFGGDELLLDGAIREGYGDAYGATTRGVSNVFEFAAGDNEASKSLDIAAAAVDPDQTVDGTLRDQGRHLAASSAAMIPGIGGEHTPVGADAEPDAGGAEMTNASGERAPAARNGDGETSMMDHFKNAVDGLGIDFSDMDGVNYAQTALAAFAAYTTFIEGNIMGGVIMGAMATFMRPALKFADDFMEKQGIDLMPDRIHTPESTNVYGGLGL